MVPKGELGGIGDRWTSGKSKINCSQPGSGGGPNGIWDDHRWGTLAALHPGVITEVARGGISYFNGGRPKDRSKNIFKIFF